MDKDDCFSAIDVGDANDSDGDDDDDCAAAAAAAAADHDPATLPAFSAF